YIGKRSIHVRVQTIEHLKDDVLYFSHDNFREFQDNDKKEIDLDTFTAIKNSEEFFSKFKEFTLATDKKLIKKLKKELLEFLYFKGFVAAVRKDFLPVEQIDFSHWNY